MKTQIYSCNKNTVHRSKPLFVVSVEKCVKRVDYIFVMYMVILIKLAILTNLANSCFCLDGYAFDWVCFKFGENLILEYQNIYIEAAS